MKKLGTVLAVLAILGTVLVGCAQTATPAPGPVGKIGPVVAAPAGKVEVKGTWTVAVTEAFNTANDIIVFGGGLDAKTVKFVASGAGADEVGLDTADTADKQAAAIVALFVADSKFTAAAATGTITFTQKAGGVGAAPTATVTAADKGKMGVVTLGVVGVAEVKGTYTVKVNTNFVVGDKITIVNKTLTAVESGVAADTFVVGDSIGTTVSAIKNAATGITNYTVTSATDTLTLTQTAASATAPAVTFTAKK